LIAANGATSTVESIGTLVGPLLAGVLVSVATIGVVFVVGAAALLIGAALLLMVRVEGRIKVASVGGRAIAAGFETLVDVPRARLVVALIVAQAFVRGCLNVLIVVVVFRVLHGSAAGVGYLTAAIGVGGLLGAFGAMTLDGRRLAASFGVALVFWGLPIALIAPRPYFAAGIVLLAVVGAANSVEDVAGFTLLQRIIPDQFLTRVLGVLWGLVMAAVAAGSIATPAVVDAAGVRPAFIVVGSILPVLTLAAYRRLVAIDRTTAPAAELQLVERIPMFEPLPLATKERVAGRLIPISVPAGTTVIRAGEVGDRFYIVGDGDFEIDTGAIRRTAHEADYFGEIALLRDVPRTATVTATADSRLFALERGDFLAAVTGHSGALAAGEEVADARLGELAAHEG
jgi:hypothetical protein